MNQTTQAKDYWNAYNKANGSLQNSINDIVMQIDDVSDLRLHYNDKDVVFHCVSECNAEQIEVAFCNRGKDKSIIVAKYRSNHCINRHIFTNLGESIKCLNTILNHSNSSYLLVINNLMLGDKPIPIILP